MLIQFDLLLLIPFAANESLKVISYLQLKKLKLEINTFFQRNMSLISLFSLISPVPQEIFQMKY